MRAPAPAALLATVLLVVGCGTTEESAPTDGPSSTAVDSTSPTASPGADDAPSPESPTDATGAPAGASRVVAISIDGLRSSAVDADHTPHLAQLFAEGVATRNARTAVEQTETLPNHVCMVTGRRISGPEGHGVTWNRDTDQTVRAGVASLFDVVARGGGSSSVVAGKPKLDILRDSWPDAVDAFRLEPDMAAGAAAVLSELAESRELVFWHLRDPDSAGHAAGWGSTEYDAAVRRADAAVGTVLDAVAADPALADEVAIVLTSDHGGVIGARSHGDAPGDPGNFTVPFVVRGPGVEAGDLYDRAPGRADPGRSRTSYAGRSGQQPVRNCDLANVVTGLLGLPDVPGSEFGTGAGLRVHD